MQKQFSLLTSRNIDFVINLTIVVAFILGIILMVISNNKGQSVELSVGWNIGIGAYFTIVSVCKYKISQKTRKGEISLITVVSSIIALAFFIAAF